MGSSPLARGTREIELIYRAGSGLIPARAGNTWIVKPARSPPWAHPRSRGEHLADPNRKEAEMGSSPLARGTRLVSEPLPGGHGLIPARAGNT